eukprot:352394-Chlamydomonas_euryale.AAC.2
MVRSIPSESKCPDCMLVLDRTRVKDVSPLAKCTDLRYLYLSRTSVKDVSPLSESHTNTALRHWQYKYQQSAFYLRKEMRR